MYFEWLFPPYTPVSKAPDPLCVCVSLNVYVCVPYSRKFVGKNFHGSVGREHFPEKIFTEC